MKKLILITTAMLIANLIFAQYAGQPFTGTPWAFGTDNAVNFKVGEAFPHKKGTFNGIPHFLYDIGKVDTSLLPSEDPKGELVAGSGAIINSSNAGYDLRQDAAATASVTLDESDVAASSSPNYGGPFSTHNNRGVLGGNGGWYRYTCNFAEGNYKMVMRVWGRGFEDCGFWIRMYDKETMNPIYPWTRFHPGSGATDDYLLENGSFANVLGEPYTSGIDRKTFPQEDWIESNDEFSLNGTVVVEFSDVGPTSDYDHDVINSGSGNFGELTFFHQGATSDKFAPVAVAYKRLYDEMDEISLALSEPGTLYIVPNGTAEANLETAKIDKKEMTDGETYTKPITDFAVTDSIQIVTTDVAGNKRFSSLIRFRSAIVADTTAGKAGDSIAVNVSRQGFVILAPATVNADLASFNAAIAQGIADTINVTTANDTLVINQTGSGAYNLYLYDTEEAKVSNPVAFTLEGGSSVFNPNAINLSVFSNGKQLIINHNGDFNQLNIYDVSGRHHITEKVSSERITINCDQLNNGVYILKMTGNNTLRTKKFIIRK